MTVLCELLVTNNVAECCSCSSSDCCPVVVSNSRAAFNKIAARTIQCWLRFLLQQHPPVPHDASHSPTKRGSISQKPCFGCSLGIGHWAPSQLDSFIAKRFYFKIPLRSLTIIYGRQFILCSSRGGGSWRHGFDVRVLRQV